MPALAASARPEQTMITMKSDSAEEVIKFVEITDVDALAPDPRR